MSIAKPIIGVDIHINNVRGCIAAKVTGDIKEYWAADTSPDDPPDAYSFAAVVFPVTGPHADATRKVRVTPDTDWHYQLECLTPYGEIT